MPNIRNLILNDTLELKGIALLLLLCHHLLAEQTGLYYDFLFRGHPLVQTFGLWSKVCVSIFVLLSGYGLMVKALKTYCIK